MIVFSFSETVEVPSHTLFPRVVISGFLFGEMLYNEYIVKKHTFLGEFLSFENNYLPLHANPTLSLISQGSIKASFSTFFFFTSSLVVKRVCACCRNQEILGSNPHLGEKRWSTRRKFSCSILFFFHVFEQSLVSCYFFFLGQISFL